MNVASEFDWLPEYQTHVLESLGYIYELMDDVATVLQNESRIGVFTFAERRRGDVEELVIATVRLLPPLVVLSQQVGDTRAAGVSPWLEWIRPVL